MADPRLLLITERRRSPLPLAELADRALVGAPPGAALVQLREKDLEARELFELARELLAVCRRHQTKLLINDRIDVALAVGADGVHLPWSSFSAADARKLLPAGALIGVSCHAAAEVVRARDDGADYATFGPLFDTPSKRGMGEPLGLRPLREAAALGLRLFGLGGVTPERATRIRAAGAYGVAAIGAWMDAVDPAAVVATLL